MAIVRTHGSAGLARAARRPTDFTPLFNLAMGLRAQAQQQRQSQPVTSNRADTSKPMYQSNRPSYSGGGGGGSFGLGFMLVLMTLLGLGLHRRFKSEQTG